MTLALFQSTKLQTTTINKGLIMAVVVVVVSIEQMCNR